MLHLAAVGGGLAAVKLHCAAAQLQMLGEPVQPS